MAATATYWQRRSTSHFLSILPLSPPRYGSILCVSEVQGLCAALERPGLDRKAEAEVVTRQHRGGCVSAPKRDIPLEMVGGADFDGFGQLSEPVSLHLCQVLGGMQDAPVVVVYALQYCTPLLLALAFAHMPHLLNSLLQQRILLARARR